MSGEFVGLPSASLPSHLKRSPSSCEKFNCVGNFFSCGLALKKSVYLHTILCVTHNKNWLSDQIASKLSRPQKRREIGFFDVRKDRDYSMAAIFNGHSPQPTHSCHVLRRIWGRIKAHDQMKTWAIVWVCLPI